MSDQTALAFVDGNFLERLKTLEATVSELQRVNINVPNLSAIVPDLGEMTSGRFIAGNLTVDDSDPTVPATFTGSGAIMDGDGIMVSAGVTAVFIAVSSGVVTFYVSATDGKMYAASGAVVIDQNGIAVSGNFQKIVQSASAAGVTTTMTFGMTTDLTKEPAAIIDVSTTATGNVVVNPDFETGTLSDWTSSGTCTIAINTSIVHGGTYSVKFSGAAGTFGDLTQAVNQYATPGVSYALSYWVYMAGAAPIPNIEVRFLDVSLTNIQTWSIPAASVYGSWQHITQSNISAPQGTAWVQVVCRCNSVFTANPADAVYFDDVSFLAQSSDSYIRMDTDITLWSRGLILPQQSLFGAYLPASGTVRLNIDQNNDFWMAHSDNSFQRMLKGDYQLPTFVNTAAKTTIYQTSTTAAGVGPNGVIIDVFIPYRFLNNSGGNRQYTITVDWGATTWTFVGVALASAANPYVGYIVFRMGNVGSAAQQDAYFFVCRYTSAAAFGTRAAMNWDGQAQQGTEDTSANPLGLTISVTLSSTGQGANYNFQTGQPVAHGVYKIP